MDVPWVGCRRVGPLEASRRLGEGNRVGGETASAAVAARRALCQCARVSSATDGTRNENKLAKVDCDSARCQSCAMAGDSHTMRHGGNARALY